MKLQITLLSFVVAAILTSCCKASYTYSTFFNNATSNTIELKSYQQAREESVILPPMSILKISSVFFLEDSIRVFKNNVLFAVHYPPNTLSKTITSKTVRFTESGNLYNPDNYTKEI